MADTLKRVCPLCFAKMQEYPSKTRLIILFVLFICNIVMNFLQKRSYKRVKTIAKKGYLCYSKSVWGCMPFYNFLGEEIDANWINNTVFLCPFMSAKILSF